MNVILIKLNLLNLTENSDYKVSKYLLFTKKQKKTDKTIYNSMKF